MGFQRIGRAQVGPHHLAQPAAYYFSRLAALRLRRNFLLDRFLRGFGPADDFRQSSRSEASSARMSCAMVGLSVGLRAMTRACAIPCLPISAIEVDVAEQAGSHQAVARRRRCGRR